MPLSQHLWKKFGVRWHESGLLFPGKAAWQQGRQKQCPFRTEGQPYSIWTRIAEQLPWQQLGSALAHKAAPGWPSHSNTLTWSQLLHACHLRAALWPRQPDPQGNRDIRSCSCPEGNEVWKPLCIVHVMHALLTPYQKPHITEVRSDMCQYQIEAWLISELIFSLAHNFNRNQACKCCLNNNPEESNLCIH